MEVVRFRYFFAYMDRFLLKFYNMYNECFHYNQITELKNGQKNCGNEFNKTVYWNEWNEIGIRINAPVKLDMFRYNICFSVHNKKEKKKNRYL